MTLPKAVRQSLGLRPGAPVIAEVVGDAAEEQQRRGDDRQVGHQRSDGHLHTFLESVPQGLRDDERRQRPRRKPRRQTHHDTGKK
ncbi:MAG: AbrB/MazE/SpoVT family DNA-binding domain-containing protein [Armatimonadetes bacterium]|nr:AbrB/MazE/SpoVT family DNA-binding domain-containing protein [Armatimonadota bacterium]